MDPSSSSQQDNHPVEFRHRNPLARDYVVISRVVLVGYPELSDGAKITYWVVYSHDWYDTSLGGRKGYAYPTVARLARLRHTTERTIQRHLGELIGVALLTRELRPGKPSVLYIEEPGGAAVDAYLQGSPQGGDKNVGGGMTGMSPHKKEEQKKNHPVNGVLSSSKTQEQIAYLVEEILKVCGDERSRAYYRLAARFVPDDVIFAALSEVSHDGPVRNPGAVFVSKIKPHLAQRTRGEEAA